MKKRILSLLLASLTLLSLWIPALAEDRPEPAAVAGSCGDNGANVRWSTADRVLTLSGVGKMRDYARQEDSPFFDQGQRKAAVTQGITYIGQYGFAGSVLMKSVTLPDSLTAIGDYAFSGCNELKDVTLGTGLRTLGACAFYACPKLEKIVLPRSCASIGEKAFGGRYRGLRSVTVENPKCVIYPDRNTLGTPGQTLIAGWKNSTAQAYAEKYGYAFTELDQKEGIVTENGRQYLYAHGQKQYGLADYGGKTYYASAQDGHLFFNRWVCAGGGRYYYCAGDGHILKGGPMTAGSRGYFVDSTGLRQTGLQTWRGKTYYYSVKDGHLLKGGWIDAGGGRRYYADETGVIIRGL